MAQLIEYLKTRQPAEFQPMPQYSEHGDWLSLYFKDEDSYGERVDNFLTVFRSMLNDELIGFEMKGVRKDLEKAW
jgi:hypothetical protein